MARIRPVALPATLLALLSACSGSSKDAPRTAGPRPPGVVATSVAEGPFEAPALALLRPSAPAPRRVAWPARPWRAPQAKDGQPSAALAPLVPEAPAPRLPFPFDAFDGIGDGIAGYSVDAAPSDSTGAVGPSHYVEAVNSAFAVYDKQAGTLLRGPVALNSLFATAGNACAVTNDGDPQVLYDQLADRWVVSQFSVGSSASQFWECVAVSRTGDPTGGWWLYSFSYPYFPDYPKMALWPDAYHVTYAKFSADLQSYLGPEVCALDRSAMLEGRTATQQCVDLGNSFGPVLVASLDGPELPPAGSAACLLSNSDALTVPFDYLNLWRFHVDWQDPASSALTGPVHVATGSYTWPCGGWDLACVTQPGTAMRLDTLGDRLMDRAVYRNFGGHASIVANQTVLASGTSGVRWWEIRGLQGSPTVHQEGTVTPDAAYRFMGSIAMDKVGNMAVGYSVSSAALSVYPGIAVSGRLSTDAPGTMPLGETVLQVGIGHQTTYSRWGDYSSMTVDPGDGCTFYYVNQFQPANGVFNWRTRIAHFTLPGCATAPDFTISAAPATLSVARGTGGTSTISTAVVSAAGTVGLVATVTPPGAGVTASLDRSSVAAGGSAVLSVTATADATLGSHSVAVTGTEGSFTHAATVAVTVPAPDFAIAATPATLSVARGASGTSTISTTQLVSAGTVGLVATVTPADAGVTASLDRSSVAAGGSALLTVTAQAGATPGSYTVTVTGTEGPSTHAAAVAVTVPPPDFTIGSDPTSLSILQGASASSTISTTVVNSAGPVNLAAAVSPAGAGVTAALDRASVAAGGSAVLTVAASASAVPGSYAVLVTGSEGALSHGTTVTVTVPAPDFGISTAPASLTVIQGSSGTSSVSTTQLVSPGTVSLAASVEPAGAGVTASLDRASVAAGGSAVLEVAVAANATPGTYTASVVGTEGPSRHATSVTVTVPPPDFTLAATPDALTLAQGVSGTSTIATTQVTAPGTVGLAATVSPAGAGVTALLDRASVTAGGSAGLAIAVAAGTAPGSHTVTVTGTEGSITHAVSVAVTVPAPDFGITATPASLTVSQGGTATSAVATTPVNGAGTVALAAAVAPSAAGVTATLDRDSVASGGTAVVTVVVSAGATPGSYAVTVTGTENSFHHEAAIAVTVPSPPAPGGGGCSSAGGNAGSLLPLLAVFLVGRLRRRGERRPSPGG